MHFREYRTLLGEEKGKNPAGGQINQARKYEVIQLIIVLLPDLSVNSQICMTGPATAVMKGFTNLAESILSV